MPKMEIELVLDVDQAAQAAYEAFGAHTLWANLGETTKATWRRVAAATLPHISQVTPNA